MTLRFSERYVLVINLLLIAILAYFIALSANEIILGRVTSGTAAHRPSLLGAEPSAPVTHPRHFYDAISRRDIFNLVPQTEAPAEVATNLHIKLLGTSTLTLSQPFIIVEDDNNHEQSLYRMGDEIPDAGKLVGVYKDHAIILHQGRRIKIEMPTDENAAPTEMRRPFGMPGQVRRLTRKGVRQSGVREVDPNRYVLDRSTVNNNLNNMASLFTQVRAVPNLGPDGKSNGFKLSEIQPDSIFQQIGLRDGDVLTDVGGQSVGDPAQAMQLLATLRNQNSISLTVMRGGQPVQLQYNIR